MAGVSVGRAKSCDSSRGAPLRRPTSPELRPTWPDPCMTTCGGLGVTSRGELRLLEPRIPGTGALFFCACGRLTIRREDGEYAWHPLQQPRNGQARRLRVASKRPTMRLGDCRRMNDDIPFDKSFALTPNQVQDVAPGVRAIAADNPGPFTFKGTVSYIIGRDQVAIIDPGPDDASHVAALLEAVRGETVTHIFVTHTHRDHSPAAAMVKAATGAIVLAQGPHRLARPLHTSEVRRLDASADLGFRPDVALVDGETVHGQGWTLEAVTTPGHTANHMAFAFKEANLLFAG